MMLDAAPAGQRLATNAWWLIKLRWVAVVGQLATVLASRFLFAVDVHLPGLVAVIAVTALSNAALAVWLRRDLGRPGGHDAWHGRLGGVMLLDLLSLTSLLYLSGGPANPFAIFYLVNLSLAASFLSARWAWLLNALAIVCLAVIFRYHLQLDELQLGGARPVWPSSVRIPLGQLGQFVAFATCGSVIVYFTTRLTAELQRREAALRSAEAQRARSEHLEALGTMAAGAAHELATPLGTIAVVVRELQREMAARGRWAEAIEDLHTIRGELDRCRSILDNMSVGAGHAAGEPRCEMAVEQFLQRVLEDLPERQRVRVHCAADVGSRTLCVPLAGLAQALRGLVQNALDATPEDASARLMAGLQNGQLQLLIEDDGQGMDDRTLRRAGEPFYTTKEPGKGMGLGLFLARSVIERLDGCLDLASVPQHGTQVRVLLPLAGVGSGRQRERL